MRYAIQHYPNETLVGIHLDRPVPTLSWLSFTPDSDDAPLLKEALMAVPGIVQVTASDYEVRIKRGAVFRWSELLEPALKAIVAFFEKSEGKPVESLEKVITYPS